MAAAEVAAAHAPRIARRSTPATAGVGATFATAATFLASSHRRPAVKTKGSFAARRKRLAHRPLRDDAAVVDSVVCGDGVGHGARRRGHQVGRAQAIASTVAR